MVIVVVIVVVAAAAVEVVKGRTDCPAPHRDRWTPQFFLHVFKKTHRFTLKALSDSEAESIIFDFAKNTTLLKY